LSYLHKIRKYNKEIGENSEKLSTKSGKIGNFTYVVHASEHVTWLDVSQKKECVTS